MGARALGSAPGPAILALPCDFLQVGDELGQAGLEASWEAADEGKPTSAPGDRKLTEGDELPPVAAGVPWALSG